MVAIHNKPTILAPVQQFQSLTHLVPGIVHTNDTKKTFCQSKFHRFFLVFQMICLFVYYLRFLYSSFDVTYIEVNRAKYDSSFDRYTVLPEVISTQIENIYKIPFLK